LALQRTTMLKLIIYLKPFAKYLLIGWLTIIIILSSIPNIPTLKIHTQRADFRLDYIMHFGEYGVLAFMAFLAFAEDEFRIYRKRFITITIGLLLFAVLDELHQKLVPGRICSIRDVASDVTGVLAAIVFTLVVFRSIKIGMEKRE
jgi:VanZ family protein